VYTARQIYNQILCNNFYRIIINILVLCAWFSERPQANLWKKHTKKNVIIIISFVYTQTHSIRNRSSFLSSLLSVAVEHTKFHYVFSVALAHLRRDYSHSLYRTHHCRLNDKKIIFFISIFFVFKNHFLLGSTENETEKKTVWKMHETIEKISMKWKIKSHCEHKVVICGLLDVDWPKYRGTWERDEDKKIIES
jgi:hypothetical protein